jgi:hypothetical protein
VFGVKVITSNTPSLRLLIQYQLKELAPLSSITTEGSNVCSLHCNIALTVSRLIGPSKDLGDNSRGCEKLRMAGEED